MPAEKEGVRTLTPNTTTALSAVNELEAALVETRRHGSGSLDRLVASAEAVIAATREPVPHAPYALRRMTLPERWKGHLIDGIDGDLTTNDLAACDALRTSIAEYGWRFTEAVRQATLAVPTVPEETRKKTVCLVFTVRRDEHPLLPAGEPVTLQDHLDALRESLARAEDGSEADVRETAEGLLRAFGR